MSKPGSLDILLSVMDQLTERAAREIIDLPLEPVQSNVARLKRILVEVRAIQDARFTQYPEPGARSVDGKHDLAADDLRLTTCLLEAHHFESAGHIGQAISTLQRLLIDELSPERRAIVAHEMERLVAGPPDESAPDLSPAESVVMHIGALAPSDLEEIDRALLAATVKQFRKVAYVVATVIHQLAHQLPSISDVFYAQRVIRLVKLGQLEAQGDLRRMRYSEVRRPR